MSRTIIHVDMDSFYVSVERLRDPSLEGLPIAVGGSADGRGVVASASYEARAYGVRSAMPMGQAIRLCPHLKVISSPYSYYETFSRELKEIFQQFTPLVEMASQDEAYLDMSGTEKLLGPPLKAAQSLRQKVLSQTRLPCSLGVGCNKLIAKVASALCKPAGLLWIPHQSEREFLAPLSIRKLPGIGEKAAARLRELGFKTISDIQNADPKYLERHFGEAGGEWHSRSLGIHEAMVQTESSPKSIGHEETFTTDQTDEAFLDGILSNLSEKVAWRLRKTDLWSKTIILKYRYQGFETHTASLTLPSATRDEQVILETVRHLFREKWSGRPIRLLGVTASNLREERNQLDFFLSPDEEKSEKFHRLLDAVREKHGYGALRRASSGGRHEEKNENQWG